MSDLEIKHAGTVQAQNSQGPMNPVAPLGQAGAIFESSTSTITAPNGSVFVAIQFIEDSTFNASGGLLAEDNTKWPNTLSGATAIDANGDVVDSPVTFPAGMTIYGRWNTIILATGKMIAYVG